MAQCTYCKVETQLIFGDRPICVRCLGTRGERKPPSTEKQTASGPERIENQRNEAKGQ